MSGMETYQQDVKEISRELVWEHAITSLTTNRERNEVLSPEYIKQLWDYSKKRVMEYMEDDTLIFHEDTITKWLGYQKSIYKRKSPRDLKIAYLCGPEPENDLKYILGYGVRIENVYAFESDNKAYDSAIQHLHHTYPLLKIIKGKIEEFVQMHSVKFDIVYLDLMGPLIRDFRTVCSFLDNNALEELSVLAVNTCFPEQNEKNIDFLSHYFFHRPFFESPILNEEGEDNDGVDRMFREGCSAYGICCEDDLKPYINRNFEYAYSAYQTNFILHYANLIKPIYCIVNKEYARKRLFVANPKPIIEDKELSNSLFCDLYEDGEPGLCSELSGYEKFPLWKDFYEKKESGMSYSRNESARCYDFLKNSWYKDIPIMSEALSGAMPKIDQKLVGSRSGLFCDVPLLNLWLDLLINQFGYPYHINMENHKRYKYRAKSNQMCLDIFTLDRCRALYDTLPTLEYFGSDLDDFERQMIVRMGMDAIAKHSIYNIHELYTGSAVVEVNWEAGHWNSCHFPPKREEIIGCNSIGNL